MGGLGPLTFIRHVLPVPIVKLDLGPRRLGYELPPVLGPERWVSAQPNTYGWVTVTLRRRVGTSKRETKVKRRRS